MANTYEDFLAQSGYTPKITAYDSSTPDISDDTFIKILNKQSTNNTPENRQRILDMWASQRARREANAKPTTYESNTVEAFTPFYSPRIGYAGSNVSGNFTNTHGWVSGGQSTPTKPEASSATPIQDQVAKLNTNFLYGKPFFHIEKPSLYYPYANKYNPGNGIIPFSALMQPSSNVSVQSGVQEASQEDAPKLTFKQAFAQAHRDGKQEFEWNGGRYKVAFKNEEPAKDAAAIQEGTTTVEPATLAPQYQTGITWNAFSQYAHDAYNAEINNKIALDKQIEGLKAIQYKNNTLYKQKVKELYDNSSAKARNYIRAAGLNPYQDTNYIKAMEGIQVADPQQNATATAASVPGNYVEKINPVTEHPMMKWYTGS